MVLRQDALSYLLMIVCVAGSVEAYTRSSTTIVLFPALLVVFGWFCHRAVRKLAKKSFEEQVDPTINKVERRDIITWSIVAVVGSSLIAYATKYSPLAVAGLDNFRYTASVAIGEEMFFRAFILELFFMLPYILPRIGILGNTIGAVFQNGYVCVVGSAGVFAWYHLARYGTMNDALIYVFGGGLLLGLSAYKLRRISQCMLSHAATNILALIGV